MSAEKDPNPPWSPQPPDGTTAGRGVVELVNAALRGEQSAWNVLVRRYTPLVDSVTRYYCLSSADAEDVSQVVWLRLFENLADLREARALPGWIKTTTKREALRTIRARRHTQPLDPSAMVTFDVQALRRDADQGMDSNLIRVEQDRAVTDGLAELAPQHRRLLVLLHTEPRASYQEISKTLGMPAGSIGPTRARCLVKLRKTDAIRSFAGSSGVHDDLEAA